ncbi:hypothetical protein CHUAL_010829 [Chamberlinius hualienensis]
MGERKRLGGGTRVEGVTNLMYACQQGNDQNVRNILARKPSTVSDRDPTGKTALHYCAENTNINCIELVLAEGPKLIDVADKDGYTPLHLAVIGGNKVIVRYLVSRRANLQRLDNEKHSVVHWATVCGEAECLSILVDAEADPSTADIHGASPIHYAAQMCGPNSKLGNDVRTGMIILRKLLAYGVNVNVTDQDGRQPLLWAASAGSGEAILALVNAGANVYSRDKDGLTALHCAASRGHNDCLETLFTLCGAELDAIDSYGCTSLFYAITLGHADCTHVLLKYGSQPNRQDRKGRTPAHCGAAKGQLETLKIFAKHGGNLWVKNVSGDLPLHEAIYSGRKDLVLWLLEQRPDAVNATNSDGSTPLHVAAKNSNVEMCKVLIDNNANINPIMKDRKGQSMTPLDTALSKGRGSCAKYLQLSGGLPASKLSERAMRPSTDDHQLELQTLSREENSPVHPTRYPEHIARFLDRSMENVPSSPHDDKASQVDIYKSGQDKSSQTFVNREKNPLHTENLLHHGRSTPKTLYQNNHELLHEHKHSHLENDSESPLSGTGTIVSTQKDSGISDRGHFSDFDSEEVPSEPALTSSESNTLDRRKVRSTWQGRKNGIGDQNKRSWQEDRDHSRTANHDGENDISNSIHSNIKRYQRERKIFQTLLELKRLQIRNGKSDEQMVVRRLADAYLKDGLMVNKQVFQGPYTYRAFDNYLYGQFSLNVSFKTCSMYLLIIFHCRSAEVTFCFCC